MSTKHPPKKIVLNSHQQAVWNCLDQATEPQGAYKILEAVPSSIISAVQQVYRALEKLIDYGLVHRIESLNAYVICTEKHNAHEYQTLFALCDTCGKSLEIRAKKAMKNLHKKLEGYDFHIKKAHVELRGICAQCHRAQQSKEMEA